MGDKAETVWGDVHERVRRRVRVLAGLILALAVAAVFDGLANYDRLGDDYQRAIELRRGNPVVDAVMVAHLLTLITFLLLTRVVITVPRTAKTDDATGLAT